MPSIPTTFSESGVRELERVLQTVLPGARLAVTDLPLTPDIKLYLLDEYFYRGPLTDETTTAVLEQPPYWCFCWASGQVLAKILCEDKSWVKNKVVVDFGSGSGVVAIAAALSGAARVYACDIDNQARKSTLLNALLNNTSIVSVSSFEEVDQPIDLIVAADVLYDQENFPWLRLFLEQADKVLLGDSRVKVIPNAAYREVASHATSTLPDLDEHKEYANVKIYVADGS